MDQHHGLSRLFPGHVATGFRDLIEVCGKEPGFFEYFGLLQFKEARVGIAPCRNIGQVREALWRCGSRRFVFHECAQRLNFLLFHLFVLPKMLVM